MFDWLKTKYQKQCLKAAQILTGAKLDDDFELYEVEDGKEGITVILDNIDGKPIRYSQLDQLAALFKTDQINIGSDRDPDSSVTVINKIYIYGIKDEVLA